MSEEEYELTPELITEVSKKSVLESKKISRRIARFIRKIARIRELLIEGSLEGAEIVDINSFQEMKPEIECYAIDSSFKSPLPLVFGDLFLVIGGYVRYPRVDTNNVRINRGLRVLIRCREELISRIQSAISRIVERKIALEILRRKEIGRTKWNLIMLDGPIVPLWPLILFTRSLYPQERKLLELSRKMINLCKLKKKSVLGIIKRVRTHLIGKGIVKILEDNGYLRDIPPRVLKAMKKANDKALATLLLRPGEALIIGDFGTSKIIESELTEIGRKATFDEFVEENLWIKKVFVLFIKPKRSRHIVRIEILDYANIGLEKIMNWLNENSSHTACPYILDIVDKYTAISNAIYELTRKIMIRSTAQNLAKLLESMEMEEVDLLLELADLQKKYIPRMG